MSVTDEYMLRAAVVVSVPIIAVLLLINIKHIFSNGRKNNKDYVEVTLNTNGKIWVYISILITIASTIMSTGFSGALAGVANGTVWGYLSMFFSSHYLILVYFLYCDKKENLAWIIMLFILQTVLTASRSGLMTIVMLLLLLLYSTNKFLKKKKKIKFLIVVLCILAPFVYLYSTTLRGMPISGVINLIDNIVGRCSCLELSGGALYGKDIGTWDMRLFQEKYGSLNQIKMSINTIFPGDLFPPDIDPNQYFRSVFMGYPISYSMNNYTSMNLTLPVYLYMKMPIAYAWILTIVILLVIYRIVVYSKLNPIYKAALAVFLLDSLLNFFDWSMFSRDLIKAFLTLSLYQFACRHILKYRIVLFRKGNCKRTLDPNNYGEQN